MNWFVSTHHPHHQLLHLQKPHGPKHRCFTWTIASMGKIKSVLSHVKLAQHIYSSILYFIFTYIYWQDTEFDLPPAQKYVNKHFFHKLCIWGILFHFSPWRIVSHITANSFFLYSLYNPIDIPKLCMDDSEHIIHTPIDSYTHMGPEWEAELCVLF